MLQCPTALPPSPFLSGCCAGPQVKAKLIREPDNRRLLVYLYQTFSKDSLSSSLLAGTWTRKSPENHQEEVVAVDLRFVLSFLDGFDGSPFMQAVDGCVGCWRGPARHGSRPADCLWLAAARGAACVRMRARAAGGSRQQWPAQGMQPGIIPL